MLIRARNSNGNILAISVLSCKRWVMEGDSFINVDSFDIGPVTLAGKAVRLELVSNGKIVSGGPVTTTSARIDDVVRLAPGQCKLFFTGETK